MRYTLTLQACVRRPHVSQDQTHRAHDPIVEDAPAENRILAKGAGFSVDLRGEESFLARAWEALRPLLLEEVAKAEAAQKEPEPKEDEGQGAFVSIYAEHALYEKVFLLHRDALQESVYGSFLCAEHLVNIHLDHDDLTLLEERAGAMHLLWNRLTAQGQKKLGGGGG